MDESPYDFLARVDKVMKGFIIKYGKLKLPKGDPFFSIIQAIIWQQVNWKTALKMAEKFKVMVGQSPEQILRNEELMSRIGLTRKKREYIKNVCYSVLTKEIDLNKFNSMSDEDIRRVLMKVKGIGRWTADMILIFGLGREDVFPHEDLIIRRAVGRYYLNKELPSMKETEKVGYLWRPFRTYASLYLWKPYEEGDK